MDKSIKRLISVGPVFLFVAFVLFGFLIFGDLVDVQKQNVKTEPTEEWPKRATARPSHHAQQQLSEFQSKSTTTSEPAQTPGAPTSATPQPSPTLSEETVEDPVSEILSRSDEDFANTVNQLFAAMSKLNPEQQAEAAQHIANLSDDALAAQWSQKMIVQSLPQPASEVLFNDLLNRPHELLMPFLSKLADMPQHSLSMQSVEILEVLFGQPPAGTKWEKWVKIKAEE